ncbi:MAG TPA: DUF2306 domain-containing protein [Propionibacteriaceae bacterium]|nr:DUF2306 domain-containing protein [Propionibacteriaceae bacterium]
MPLPSASLSLATRRAWIRTPGPFLGWAGVAVCALYAGFGVYTAVLELLSLAGMVAPMPTGRAAPPVFVLHALTGSVALVCAALQLRLASRLLSSRPRVHRAIGRTYVLATWITSAGGMITVAFFDVSWPGNVVFAVWAISWSTATAVALQRVRAGRYGEHREWMLRSFALALVFMTFDLSRSAFASLGLPSTAVYPLGLLLSSAVSLAVAELALRASSAQQPGHQVIIRESYLQHDLPVQRVRARPSSAASS